jgi:hypothetical protein
MQPIRVISVLSTVLLLGACLPSGTSQASRAASNAQSLLSMPPDGYNRLFSPMPHNYRRGLAEAGDPVRLGATSERFELRDGDCGGTDCTTPRARAEIQQSNKENPARIGESIWYGWSFYNASIPSFVKENSLRLVFGQWKVGGQQLPIFRLIQLGKGEGGFKNCDPSFCVETTASRGDVVVQLEGIAKSTRWGDAQNNGYICRLFDMADQSGKWVDLTVNTNFSPGSDGYLRVWVNGDLACNYSGPLVSIDSAKVGAFPQHRRGVFSSWDKRWLKATGNARKPSLIVYYDEFRIGKSMAEVDVRIRAAKSAKLGD